MDRRAASGAAHVILDRRWSGFCHVVVVFGYFNITNIWVCLFVCLFETSVNKLKSHLAALPSCIALHIWLHPLTTASVLAGESDQNQDRTQTRLEPVGTRQNQIFNVCPKLGGVFRHCRRSLRSRGGVASSWENPDNNQ